MARQGFSDSSVVWQGDSAFKSDVGTSAPVGGIGVAGGVARLVLARIDVGCWDRRDRCVFGLVVALAYGPVRIAIELESIINPLFLVLSGFFR